MKNYYIILFALVGVLGLFTSCEKDGDMPVLKENTVAPTISALPNLALARANGANVLEFKCKEVDAGFNASVNYFLEVCKTGNEFEDVIQLYNGTACDDITMSVSELNAILLDIFPEDATSSADFRIRSVLIADGGYGVDPIESISQTVTGDVTVFGLLRLDVIIAGATGKPQKIVSAASDGSYEGYVKFESGDTFTLLDPDNTITYGKGNTGIAVDGSEITISDAGWYKINADTEALSYESLKYLVGIVGVVNDWSAPDLAMDYDASGKFWYRNGVVLPDGGLKFRHNEAWGADFNFGVEDNSVELDFSDVTLYNDGGSQDLPMTAGTYDIKLWINLSGTSKCSIVPSVP